MNKNLALSGCFVLALVGGISYACTANAAVTRAPDFIEKASISNQFEISSSRLALQNSQNEDVQSFARTMIEDHSQLGDQLKSVISTSSAKLKRPSVSMDSKHQRMLNELNKLSGDDFDKKYVAEQVAGHKEAAHLFDGYAHKGDNVDLKNFAQQNLPTIKEHLQHVEELQSSM
jgi:putative membrane protein